MYIKLFENFDQEYTEIDLKKYNQYIKGITQDFSDLDVESLEDILILKGLIDDSYELEKSNELKIKSSESRITFTIHKLYASYFVAKINIPISKRKFSDKYYLCDGFGGLIKIIRKYAK